MASEMTQAADDPQAADWGDLSWSDWHDFDEAHHGNVIPDSPGSIGSEHGMGQPVRAPENTERRGPVDASLDNGHGVLYR
jgi:hypothetical protein